MTYSFLKVCGLIKGQACVEYLIQFTQSLTDTFLTGSVILVVNIYSQTIPDILFKSGTNELGSWKVGKDCVAIVDDKYMNDELAWKCVVSLSFKSNRLLLTGSSTGRHRLSVPNHPPRSQNTKALRALTYFFYLIHQNEL
ncbi:hypothetical protein BCV71DRAFT_231853 [Rhizopus microsporus]|uniref:Uncharacterized protein n=1 Tax=Rhizopus microsporus TaxID=58291 RepID=A0A1X0SCH3_RHIZD|nr:hypothetical protein BCV71DRAFT_231853 [Rhizopus microsporus]